jgi:hypothetical protein
MIKKIKILSLANGEGMGRPVRWSFKTKVSSPWALLARALAMLAWALPRQSLLKLLDLLFDFLFAVAGRKEDIVGILELFFPFAMAAVPVCGIVFLIFLKDARQFFIGFCAGKLHGDFIGVQAFALKDAEFFQAVQPEHGGLKAAVEGVKGFIKMEFGGKRTAEIGRVKVSAGLRRG